MCAALSTLDREGVCARLATLRTAMDVLLQHTEDDGAGVFHCLGAMKLEFVVLESRVRELDRLERPTAQPRDLRLYA